jgi:multiple sugar transport system substrate-binding protein
MDPFKKRMIALGGLLVVVIGGIVVYRAVTGGSAPSGACGVPAPKSVALTWWGTLPAAAVQPVINAYVAGRPYVSIAYTQLDAKTGEQQLIEAWARDTGPDIYSLRNEQLKHFTSIGLVSPMPPSTTSFTYTKKKTLGIKEELEICQVTRAAPSAEVLTNTFIAGAVADITRGGQIYGFPLQFDSLAMFYNQQLLDEAGILTPPKTWDEIRTVIPKLTLLDDKGNVIRAGAALGLGSNIPNMPEILRTIMLQFQVKLTDPTGSEVLFPAEKGAKEVVEFATSFANPTKTTYTWDSALPSALDALAQGKTAIAFGTQAELQKVQEQTTGADIRVTTFPQATDRGTTFTADYWVETVAAKVKDLNVAWDFLRFAADTTQVQTLLQQTQGTPTLRALLGAMQTSEESSATTKIFALQAATATGWFNGTNPEKAREALNELVDTVATQKDTTENALLRAGQLFSLALRAS